MPKFSTIAVWFIAPALSFAQDSTVFRVPVRIVALPTVVTSSDGDFVRGIQATEFRVFDNELRQKATLDYVDQPISMAVVVQINQAVRAWLPSVRRVASLVEAMLLGETGEASVITFSDDLKALQPLSHNAALLDRSFASFSPSGTGSRCLDAIGAAAKQLAASAGGHRRVILLVAQSGDVGSVAKLRDVLRELELNNIVIYSLVMPRVGRDLIQNTIAIGSTSGQFGRADTGMMGTVDLGKLVPEIFRGAKSSSGQDESTVLTSEMGGRQIPFRKLHDLEEAISRIGQELHTEYLLSYTPDQNTPGYHRIRVTVERPDVAVRSRPGYYVPPLEQ